MPHLNRLLEEFKAKGLDIITVNSGDSAETIARFWQERRLSLRVAMQGTKVAATYQVQAIPTNYVIGSDGKILARFEGFDEQGIRAALAGVGVK